MMSRTHLTMGMATALALTAIESPAACALALAGGALGGVLADADTLNNDYKHDALVGELLAIGITAVAAVLDYFLNWGICVYVNEHRTSAIIGAVGFAVLWIICFNTEHRSFSHSIIAMLLFTLFASFIHIILGVAVFCGYVSHLLLDILNKKKIRLFFPLRGGVCLNWCSASKTANTVFLVIGMIGTAVLLIYRILVLSSAL